jgi:hypothetical protein
MPQERFMESQHQRKEEKSSLCIREKKHGKMHRKNESVAAEEG